MTIRLKNRGNQSNLCLWDSWFHHCVNHNPSHDVRFTLKGEQKTNDFHTFEKVSNMVDSDKDKQIGNSDSKIKRENMKTDVFTEILTSLERSKNVLHPLDKKRLLWRKNKQIKKETWLKKIYMITKGKEKF